MPLIVNGVARFTFEGTYASRPWANVFDMFIDTTGTVLDRAEEIYDCAGNLINSWAEHIQPRVTASCQLDRVSWVDLDSANGSTGARSQTSEHTLPIDGNRTGDPHPGSVAVLVTKFTVSARGQRHGRWYQCGIAEPDTNRQDLAPGPVSAFQTAFTGFLNEANDSPLPGLSDRYAVVVHTTGSNPQFGTSSRVTAMTVQERLATQRRRLRG